MKIDSNYEWSTHRPLLQGVVAAFKPDFILELGMGVFSTPIFVDYAPEELLCVENDEEWLNHMKASFGYEHQMLLHKLDPNILLGTHPYQLTPEQRSDITNYYKELSKVIEDKKSTTKFLFVDNFTCCRTIAINNLYKNFDIIAYHDCQPEGIAWYEYYFDEGLTNGYTYHLLKTPTSWTGVFIKNTLDYTELSKVITPFITEYCEDNNLDIKQVYMSENC